MNDEDEDADIDEDEDKDKDDLEDLSSCHHADGVGGHRQVSHRLAPDTDWLLPPVRLVISSQSFRPVHLVPVILSFPTR